MVGLASFGAPGLVAASIAVLAGFGLRGIAILKGLSLPGYRG